MLLYQNFTKANKPLMNKQKIIPYRLLDYDTTQDPKLMVTSRKEIKIKIKSKIKGKTLINKTSAKPDDFLQSKPSTSEGKRSGTESSSRVKLSDYPNSDLSSEQLFNILKSSSINSNKSTENLTRLKSLN